MSWSKNQGCQVGWRINRVAASIIATLTLIFGLVAPVSFPNVAGNSAIAQTKDIGINLDSAGTLHAVEGDTPSFEGHFAEDGIVEELEFSARSVGSFTLSDGDYTLNIGGEEVPLREGNNLIVDTSNNPITFRITGLSTQVSPGTPISLKTPSIEGEAALKDISITARTALQEDVSGVDRAAGEDSPKTPETESKEEGHEEEAQQPHVAFRSAPDTASPRAAGDRTFTIGSQYEYILKGTRFIPDFQIPSNQLTNGTITLVEGTEITLDVTRDKGYIAPNQDDLKIFYNGKNGGWFEAPAKYEQTRKYNQFKVVLSTTITIGGSAHIQFMGVHRGRNTNFSATFKVPAPPAPRCEADAEIKNKQPRRELTKEEFSHGSPIYVVTSEGRSNSSLNRQYDQGRNYEKISKTPWVYNALAYDPNDNWLYAVSQDRGEPCYPGGNLLQIDPSNGDIYNLGPIQKRGSSGSPFETEGDQNVINTGVFTSEGYFIGNTSTSGTRHMYKVNTDSVTAQRVFGDQKSYSEDWAVLPGAEKYMWGFQSKAQSGDTLILERIDTQTGKIKTWDLTDIETLDRRKISNPSSSWGKAWTYANGNLGFGSGSTNANQLGFELKITNSSADSPKFELVNIMNNLPASYNTDAASNVVAPPEQLQSNLAVKKLRSETKQIKGEARTYWTITVENTTENPSSGGSFFEYLPTDTHYGVNTKGKTARFEGFGPGSSKVNGKGPGPDQLGDQSGIYAGMDLPSATEREERYMRGYVGTMPGKTKVEFVVSSPIRQDKYGNLKTVCSPNKVGLQATDSETSPANDDNVATEACFQKVEKDSQPQPVEGTENEYTATYNVVVSAPDAPGFDTNDVVYGKLTDTPKFVGAATLIGASVVFKDEFNNTGEVKTYSGAGPYELNENDKPKIIKPKKTSGSSGQHVYEVTVRFRLDRTKLNNSSVPAGYPSQPSGNHRCYIKAGLHEPNFGLMNEVEMGGWKDTGCIPIEDQKMDVLVQKVSYDKDAPGKLQNDNLLGGAEFAVHRGDTEGNLQLRADGSVNTDTNPLVKRSETAASGPVQLKGLDAPGVYYLIETKAPQGYNLLSKPVKFSTKWDAKGHAVIEVLSGGALAVSGNECSKVDTADCNKKIGILQIADVTKGELPKTGGSGVGLWALTGAVLVIIGCCVLWRRRA